MFGIDWYIIAIAAVVFAIVACILERFLARRRNKIIGLILPAAWFLASIVLSIFNFELAFLFVFSLKEFIAALGWALLFNIYTAILMKIYKNERHLVKHDKRMQEIRNEREYYDEYNENSHSKRAVRNQYADREIYDEEFDDADEDDYYDSDEYDESDKYEEEREPEEWSYYEPELTEAPLNYNPEDDENSRKKPFDWPYY